MAYDQSFFGRFRLKINQAWKQVHLVLIVIGSVVLALGIVVVISDVASITSLSEGPEGDFPLIRSGLLAAGAVLLGVGVALQSLATQRELARKQATIAMLNRNVWDQDCIKALRMFIQLGTHEAIDGKGQPEGLEYWTNPRHRGSVQSQAINAVLNDYEMIALGIRKGIIDEGFYKSFARSTVISHWNLAAKFIEELRRQRPNGKLFIEFQGLVEAWELNNFYEGSRPLNQGIARQIKLNSCDFNCQAR